MKKTIAPLALALLAALAVGPALSLSAAEAAPDTGAAAQPTPDQTKPAKPAKKAKPAKGTKAAKGAAFKGKITAVDKVQKTITIDVKGKSRVLHVTSKTRLFKAGKPATLDQDVQVDGVISGRANFNADGKGDAIMVRLGAETDAKAKAKGNGKAKRKAKKNSPAPKTEPEPAAPATTPAPGTPSAPPKAQ